MGFALEQAHGIECLLFLVVVEVIGQCHRIIFMQLIESQCYNNQVCLGGFGFQSIAPDGLLALRHLNSGVIDHVRFRERGLDAIQDADAHKGGSSDAAAAGDDGRGGIRTNHQHGTNGGRIYGKQPAFVTGQNNGCPCTLQRHRIRGRITLGNARILLHALQAARSNESGENMPDLGVDHRHGDGAVGDQRS